MALSAAVKVDRRGPPGWGAYGYQVAAGEKIFRGGIVALNASGTLQRVQTVGSVAVVGLASQDYDNSASASASPDYVVVERGTWQLTVPNASAANIEQGVYATDDNTLTLTPPIGAAAGGSNTGNGTIGSLAAQAGAKMGAYTVKFSVTDPNGDTLASGTVGSAYSNGDIGFTITAGGTAFAANDTFTITVGAMLVGTLNGFDKGLTFVRIRGS
jgi:hypothetical protein